MSVLEQRGSVRASETLETRDKRLNESLNKALTGVNEAMVEITLEDVGSDVRMLFSKLRLSFTDYILTQDTNTQVRDTFSQEELDKNKKAVIKQAEELKTIMQQHLKEPVS